MFGSISCFLVALFAAQTEGDPGTASGANSIWYSTLPIDRTYVDEKSRIALSAAQAARVLGPKRTGPPPDWRKHLPRAIEPAERVSSLPDDAFTGPYIAPRPLDAKGPPPPEVQVSGFDEDRVSVLLVRLAGNYQWHWFYSVEADLMFERSDAIDNRLGLESLTKPFLRTVDGIGYGSSRQAVHETLGPPDATRTTQTAGLAWDYYFERKVTIEYRFHVLQITDGIPSGLREHPLVRFRNDVTDREGS